MRSSRPWERSVTEGGCVIMNDSGSLSSSSGKNDAPSAAGGAV